MINIYIYMVCMICVYFLYMCVYEQKIGSMSLPSVSCPFMVVQTFGGNPGIGFLLLEFQHKSHTNKNSNKKLRDKNESQL